MTAVSPSRKARALELFSGVPAEYDAAGALLSFGQDPRWRRALVAAIAPAPTDRVLDVATGTGLVAAALIEQHGCSVLSVDQSEEMLARAHARYWINALALGPAGVLVALACVSLSHVQRRLSTPARELRRRTVALTGCQRLRSGEEVELSAVRLAEPLEAALGALAMALPLLAAGLVLPRLI